MRIVGGSRRGRKILSPKGLSVRPTSERIRESLFDIIMHGQFDKPELKKSKVIDFFAGTGALGLEALSRGAKSLIAIEHNKYTLEYLRKNIEKLEFSDQVTIIHGDATKLPPAKEYQSNCSYAFLDPPYDSNITAEVIKCAYQGGWLDINTVIVIEISNQMNFDIPEEFKIIEDRLYGRSRLLFIRLSN